MRFLTGSLWILSLVSLFTDMASEMLYPVMPVYLQSVGYSVLVIGILEGIAEAVAGLSKGYFGSLSDLSGKRLPFVRFGYMLSAISKPVMGLFPAIWVIFLARLTDRLGKGVRTGARDAMISDAVSANDRGKAFGFHRSVDTVGAVAGPLLALVWLSANPGDYKTLFVIAFIPGLVAVGLTLLLKEYVVQTRDSIKKRPGLLDFFSYWKTSSSEYRRLVACLLLFFAFNSSDVFLLMRLKDVTGSDSDVIYLYVFYNLVYALAALPLGMLADRIGLKSVMILGLLVFAGVYIAFPFAESTAAFMMLFLLYGLYAAATEGVAKAWISLLVPRDHTATAIGGFAAVQSLALLLASAMAGLVWFYLGPETAFILSAVAALAACVFLLRTKSGGAK